MLMKCLKRHQISQECLSICSGPSIARYSMLNHQNNIGRLLNRKFPAFS
uniref:Uncharacterized protein n=1 Tax=Octopus bimaculoides TaxID=37653 RepID=A0A0L8G2W9_OCTBM